MLKKILILALTFLTALSVKAQNKPFDPTTHLGIQGGFNFSKVSFRPKVGQNFVVSNAYGLVFRHVSEPNIGLQIEAGMAGKGWEEVIDSVGTYRRKLTTYDLKALAAFIAGRRTLQFAFTIGPYVSYVRDESESIEFAVPAEYKPYYNKPLYSNWEFGFTGGASVEVHTKAGVFAVRAAYSHALNNLFPLDRGEFYFNASRSQVIHGGLMYMFTF